MSLAYVRTLAAAAAFICLLCTPVVAQKMGGTLNGYISANPPSLSIHEEADITPNMASMAVFNNLVLFDQRQPRNSFETIIPDLAEKWDWDGSGTKLTFQLRQGVTWHDGTPFTARDVQCTWARLIGKEDYFRKNPRRSWYENLQDVSVEGDLIAIFHLKRPQASLLPMLASGFSPVYSCHATAGAMRTNPIGTGPFRFVEFKSNTHIKLVRNQTYWRLGAPYLDEIQWRIVPNRATRILGLIAGEFDLTPAGDVTVPLMADIAARAPHVKCTLGPTNISSNVLINRNKAPFDDRTLRRAVMMALDRQSFIEILSHGKSSISGVMLPLPEGLWGMPPDVLASLPGYGGDVVERQGEARTLMQQLGYGPTNRLKVKVATRDFQAYKDAALILVDQLNKIHFEAELDVIETTQWLSRLSRQDIAIGLTLTGSAADDPDAGLAPFFACHSELNYTKYCNPEVDQLIEQQSRERDTDKRRQLVWQIERVLAEDVAMPIIYHARTAQCWQPALKGYVRHENSIFNNWRFEHAWLER